MLSKEFSILGPLYDRLSHLDIVYPRLKPLEAGAVYSYNPEGRWDRLNPGQFSSLIDEVFMFTLLTRSMKQTGIDSKEFMNTRYGVIITRPGSSVVSLDDTVIVFRKTISNFMVLRLISSATNNPGLDIVF